MKITQEVDYALRVMLFLSKSKESRVEARRISEEENIPLRFLLKLLRKLTTADIVKSFRGVKGGYALNMLPENITLRMVVEAVEGELYINKCMENPEYCNLGRRENCLVHKALSRVQKALIKELDSINFKDIMNNNI